MEEEGMGEKKKNKNKYTAPQPETVGENPRYGQG